MPPFIVQLIAAVVGEVFRQVLLNLPALEAGLREVTTSRADEARADPALIDGLADELGNAIAEGRVPPP